MASISIQVRDCKRIKFCFLLHKSETELLVSLKKLIIQRAQFIGQESLTQKINIKMLRALGYIVMQHAKKQVKDLSVPGLSESADLLNAGNLLNCDLMVGVKPNGDFEIDRLIDQRKRKIPGSFELSSSKRIKSTVSEIS